MNLVQLATLREIGKAFAVRHGDGQTGACHALEKQARGVQHFHLGQAGLKALAAVGGEARPGLRARNDVGQFSEHLAAVAHAQPKGVAALEEGFELIGQARVEGDAARPANACTQGVAIAEATAGHQAFEVCQLGLARLQVGHVHVIGVEARLMEGIGHFHMGVHALLSQNGHPGARRIHKWRSHILQDAVWQVHMQTWVCWGTGQGVLGICAFGVVALLADAPTYAVPDLMQIGQRSTEHLFGIAPDTDLPFALVDGGRQRAGFAHKVAVARETVRAQDLHDLVAIAGANLQDHAQLFVEQGFQGQFFAACADLRCPVFAVAVFRAAVVDAIAFGDQQIHIQRHADLRGKGHFTDCRDQAAIAAVMVGQQLSFLAQLVHGLVQAHEVLWVVQIRHRLARLCQDLPQDAAPHAVLAMPQVNQHQGGVVVLGVELRRQGATHIRQRGEGADDQADGGSHFVVLPLGGPLGSHRQAVFAHRNGNAQGRAELQAHRTNGVVQGGILTGLATGGHPVGREFDARELDWRRQQIGQGFSDRHAARGWGIHRSQRGALAHAHGLAGHALEVGQGHGAIGHGHLPRTDHGVAVGQSAHRTVANGDQEALGSHRGVAEDADHGFLQGNACEVHGRRFASDPLDISVHLGGLAQEHIHGHVNRRCNTLVHQLKLSFVCGHADHRKRATLALAKRLKQWQGFGCDRHHIALLALVRPDFLGRQA